MSAIIKIVLYRWTGQRGPFGNSSPYGDSALSNDIISDVLHNELADIPVELEIKDWRENWLDAIRSGAWRTPAVLVNNKVISQGKTLNRSVLIESVITEWTQHESITGNIIFGKNNCAACIKAKKLLDSAGIPYEYYDIIKNSMALYRMLPHVRNLRGPQEMIAMPQIWLNGEHIKNLAALESKINKTQEKHVPNNVIPLTPRPLRQPARR